MSVVDGGQRNPGLFVGRGARWLAEYTQELFRGGALVSEQREISNFELAAVKDLVPPEHCHLARMCTHSKLTGCNPWLGYGDSGINLLRNANECSFLGNSLQG